MNLATLTKLIRKLAKEYHKRIFTLREVALLCEESDASVGMALLRARENGIVDRVCNLWINRLDPPTLTDLALELKAPSYLSFESALYKQGILSQSPKGLLTIATNKRPSIVTTPLGDIQFIHLSSKIFFGFDVNRVAFPEKAFLDLIYIRCRRGTLPLSEMFYTDLLNKKQIIVFAKRFPDYVKKILLEYL